MEKKLRPRMTSTCVVRASAPGRDHPRVTTPRPRKVPGPKPLSALLSLLSASKDDAQKAEALDPATLAQVRIVASSPKLRTVNGDPVRAAGLGGNRNVRQPKALAPTARAHGVNYFFAYSMRDDQIGDYLDGLAELCSDPKMRKKIFVAVGTEDFTDREALTAHVERCLSRLGTSYIDAFFLEYVPRGAEAEAVETIRWMRNEGGLVVSEGGRAGVDGVIRYVGASTHDRCAGNRLLRSQRNGRGFIGEEPCEEEDEGEEEERDDGDEKTATDLDFEPCELDFLMARYNMAHVKSERTLFPLATARDVPVVAFTTTRWNSLQKEPAPDGWTEGAPPTTAECMRWALAADDAVEVVLNSAPTTETLGAWCEDWAARGDGVAMGADEVAKWRRYGELVYEEDAPFETYT